MRSICLPVITACLAATVIHVNHAVAQGAPARNPEMSLPPIKLTADLWYTMGESSWEIFFGEFDEVLGPLTGTSRLEWEDVDGPLFVLGAEVALTEWLSLHGRLGVGEADDGRGSDTDFLRAPRSGFGETTLSVSEFEAESDVESYDISLHARVMEWGGKARRGSAGFFVGYQYAEEEFRMRNGVQTVIVDDPVSFGFDDVLDSQFDFEWDGFRLGVDTRMQFSPTVWIEGSVAYLADVDYDGEGFWNLRDDFRSSSPNFVQSSSSGDGHDVEIVIIMEEVFENIDLRAGYRWTEWTVDDGEDRVFTSGGEILSAELTEATTERHGFFIGAGIDL